MEASVVESRSLQGALGTARRPWYDIRPVVLVSSYVTLHLVIDAGTNLLGPSSALSHWHLPAGLGLALLTVYGIVYAPAILAACLIDGLWLHPLPLAFPRVGFQCLTMTLVCCLSALALRRGAGGYPVTLNRIHDVLRFLVTGLFASVALAGLITVDRAVGSPVDWNRLLAQFHRELAGFATGIFTITPFFLIQAAPRFNLLLSRFSSDRPTPSRYLQSLRVDRPTTLFALSLIGLTGVIFWLILGMGVRDPFQIFLLLSLPLLSIAVKHGLEGVSIATPVLVLAGTVALWYLETVPDFTGVFQTVLLAASLNAIMCGAGVAEAKITGRQMDRRDAILDAVSYAAEQFLGKSGWEHGIQEVMKRLGAATAVTRVFITDKRMSEHGNPAKESWLHEWTMPGVTTDASDRKLLGLLRGQLIEEHTAALGIGQPLVCRTAGMDHKKREMFEALGVRSAVIVPMFVEHQWWGCLGLEQCYVDREWPPSEVNGLRMAGQVLGTLIASVRVEQQFRQLTGNIQAVFWISSADGHYKHYVSPGYEEIWGRSCANLHRQPDTWLDAIHYEDQSRVREALVKQVWGEYDEQYRVMRPDNSFRWVRDRAFPVRDQTGQVYRIVGIAEDITKQKKAEEQLRVATALLSKLIDNLPSGVLVEDESRRIIHVNQSFISMFDVPVPPSSLFGVDTRLLFVQPVHFAQRIEEIIQAGTPVIGEELHWQDHIFVRNFIPLSVGDEYNYNLWQYRDITVSRRAEDQIRSSLREKEVLLKEIHHRVKNNLQIICSLLSLQASEIEDPNAGQTFKESQDRVKAMALIHERLYQSGDLAKIDFAGYVRNLTGHLLRSYKVDSKTVRLNLDVAPVPMSLDVAIPCGLIINELVSNALKYAFPHGKSGEIIVRFGEGAGQMLMLHVSDTGVGLPEGTDPERSESLGLKLVRSLTEQLDGTVCYSSRNGFQCEIRIPQNSKT